MKKALTILGLLALLSPPTFAQPLGSSDDTSSNAGMESTPRMGTDTGMEESSGVRTQGAQGQGPENIRQPGTNSDDNNGTDTGTIRGMRGSGMNQMQGSQTGGAAGTSETENNGNTSNPETVRGYW